MPSYTRKVEIPGKNAQELYDTVSCEIQKFIEKLSIGNFEISHNPDSKEVYLKSSMVTATLCCQDQALELDAKLSLMAAPFRSKIDQGIDRWLAKTFNLPGSSA
jgi:hypothetical protein